VRRGFTLLEVLVVVAVIALLVAVLIPSLARARRQAKQLVCQTNLHSIAAAWHAYFADYDGWLLKSDKGIDNEQINYGGKQGSGGKSYGSKADSPVDKPLNKYLGIPLVIKTGAEPFKCPFDRGGLYMLPTCYDYFGSSYLMNLMLVGPDSGLSAPPNDPAKPYLVDEVCPNVGKLNVAQLGAPSRLLLAGDYGWYNALQCNVEEENHIDWHHKPSHYNIAFVDTHVDFVHIHKGLYTTEQYTVIPFQEQQSGVCDHQQEGPCM
jgi:prepilin-type N-terminal cleavage/methylation domain-containing protein